MIFVVVGVVVVACVRALVGVLVCLWLFVVFACRVLMLFFCSLS